MNGDPALSGVTAKKDRASNCSNRDVTVIIPAYNEEAGIALTLSELMDELDDPQYLVIDGNSADKTAKIASQMGAEVVFQEGDEGKGQAMAQALAYVNPDTRYVVFTDADFTYPAEYVPKMIDVMEKNPEVGMVTGDRFSELSEYEKSMNRTFYLGNKLLGLSHSLLNGVKLKDPFTGLRLVRWSLLKDWKPRSKGFDIEAELNHYVLRKGYGMVEIPIKYRPRVGVKKLHVKHGVTILKRILSEALEIS